MSMLVIGLARPSANKEARVERLTSALLCPRESCRGSGVVGQMVTGMGAWPSYLRKGPISVSIGEQTAVTEPSESSADPEEGPYLLKTALEEQLDGCRVSRILGVGGVSACFAANIQPYGDVAVKVTSRGSSGGSSWLAEAAEVNCTRYMHMQ